MPEWLRVIGGWLNVLFGGLKKTVLYLGDPERLKALAQLLSALASLLWPLVLFALLYAYRDELWQLIRRLKKARVLAACGGSPT